jgi:hypothetical protein
VSHAAAFMEVGIVTFNTLSHMATSQISKELQEFMLLNSISDVAAFDLIPDEDLILMDGFSWHLLKEILSFRSI